MPDLTPIRQFLAENTSEVVEIAADDLKLLVDAAARSLVAVPRVPELAA